MSKTNLLLLFLAVITTASLYAGFELSIAAPFYFACVAIVSLVSIFLLETLGYEIGGTHLSIKKRLKSLEETDETLKELVTVLAKAIYMVSSENAPAFGFSKSQSSIIDATLAPINHLINGDIKAAAEEALRDVTYHKSPP